jgi:hypothetical protein
MGYGNGPDGSLGPDKSDAGEEKQAESAAGPNPSPADPPEIDWASIFAPALIVDPLRVELCVPVDPEPVASYREAELREALENRIPPALFRRALFEIMGETGEGRLVATLEFRRPEGSLLPAAHLLDSPEPSDNGDSRGLSSKHRKKPALKTMLGSGSMEARDWEVVPGQVSLCVTERYPGSAADGFLLAFRASTFESVERMFAGVGGREPGAAGSCARLLLNRAVAEKLRAELGVEEDHPDYISISPLEVSPEGRGSLSVVVAVRSPRDGRFYAIEGSDLEVGLSPAKLITVTGGAWFNRGLAEHYLAEGSGTDGPPIEPPSSDTPPERNEK